MLWRSQSVTQENPPLWSTSATSYWQDQMTKTHPHLMQDIDYQIFQPAAQQTRLLPCSHRRTPASCEHQRFKRQSSVSILSPAIHRWCWAHPEILSRSKMAQAKHRGAQSNKRIQLMTAAHVKKAEKLGTSFTCKHGMKQKVTSGSNKKQWLTSKNMWTTRLEH